MNKITQIAIHVGPHLDELFAAKLLLRYGEKAFPGISNASIITAGPGKVDSLAALAQGTIYVGVGLGIFDEHQKSGGRMENECAATLVARYLKIDTLPELRYLLRAVLEADQNATGPMQELAATIKTINRYSPISIDPIKVYEWASVVLDALIAKQEEYLSAVKIAERCYKDRVCGILLFVRDGVENTQFPTACRNVAKGTASMIIQKSPRGNIQIFGGKTVPMQEIVGAIRLAEWRERGHNHNERVPCKNLQVEGTIHAVPQWYFEGDLLLNGSESHPNVEPSRLSARSVYEIICSVLHREQGSGQNQKREETAPPAVDSTGTQASVLALVTEDKT